MSYPRSVQEVYSEVGLEERDSVSEGTSTDTMEWDTETFVLEDSPRPTHEQTTHTETFVLEDSPRPTHEQTTRAAQSKMKLAMATGAFVALCVALCGFLKERRKVEEKMRQEEERKEELKHQKQQKEGATRMEKEKQEESPTLLREATGMEREQTEVKDIMRKVLGTEESREAVLQLLDQCITNPQTTRAMNDWATCTDSDTWNTMLKTDKIWNEMDMLYVEVMINPPTSHVFPELSSDFM